MATRYWIGGTGNWSDTAHWSATSGGVGGASVPTMDDDVYFDSNSGTGSVTVNAIANMRDCTFAQTQLITLANAAYAFNIFGNWTLCSDTYLNTSFTGTGYVYLKATTSVNITSNGCTRRWNILYLDGVGGTWTNQDDWNGATNVLRFANGTLNTNSKTINFTEWRLGQGIKTLITGASLLKSSNGFMWNVNNTGFSFNKDFCTIEVNGGGWAEFGGNVLNDLYLKYSGNGGGATVGGFICNNLYIQPYSDNSINTTVFGSNSVTINNGLYIIGRNSSNYRHLISSNTIGVPRTITCNGTVTASNVDFRDIVGAGTANWDLSNIAGGSGDCGGNSGITFTPAQTQYFKTDGLEKITNISDREFSSDSGWWSKSGNSIINNNICTINGSGRVGIYKSILTIGKKYIVKISVLSVRSTRGIIVYIGGGNPQTEITTPGQYIFEGIATTNSQLSIYGVLDNIIDADIDNISVRQVDICEYSDELNWFSNYERTIAGRVPLPQDDAIFDENSFTGASTLNVNVPRIGGLNMEGVDKSVIFYLLNVIGCHGNFLFNENISYAFSAKALHFFSIYDCYLSTHNAKMWDVVFYNRSKITLLSNFQPNVFYLYEPLNGIFDLNGFTVSCYWFQPIYSGSYTTILGTGCIETKTYGSSTAFKPTTNFFAQESTIIFNSPNTAISIQIYLSGKSFNIIIIAGENINLYVIKDNGSINELIINSGRKVHFTNGTTQTIGKLTAIGTPEQPITIGSTTSGSKYTLNLTGTEPIETDYINITDCNITQTNKFYAGVNSINGGNNTNVIFDYAELPLNMNLYTLKMYDKVLTDDEVLQNYNATKNRYII